MVVVVLLQATPSMVTPLKSSAPSLVAVILLLVSMNLQMIFLGFSYAMYFLEFFNGNDMPFFGGMTGRSQPKKDPPVTKDLFLTLEEVYSGCTKKMKISRRVRVYYILTVLFDVLALQMPIHQIRHIVIFILTVDHFYNH